MRVLDHGLRLRRVRMVRWVHGNENVAKLGSWDVLKDFHVVCQTHSLKITGQTLISVRQNCILSEAYNAARCGVISPRAR